jgi:hypothetical protein
VTAVTFIRSFVAVGRHELVTGFLKADTQWHLVEVHGGSERQYAACDDGGVLAFQSADAGEVELWIADQLVDFEGDCHVHDFTDVDGRFCPLPMFSPAPGKAVHRAVRAWRKVRTKSADEVELDAAIDEWATLLEPVDDDGVPDYEVDRGLRWE